MSDYELYALINPNGEIATTANKFVDVLKNLVERMNNDDMESSLDNGVCFYKIVKIRRRPFKILREVQIEIHDEIKRKECETNASTEDHSCDNLFKEW